MLCDSCLSYPRKSASSAVKILLACGSVIASLPVNFTQIVPEKCAMSGMILAMSTRLQNETKFSGWDELPGGGRRYWLDVTGRLGWRARYLKDVDAQRLRGSASQAGFHAPCGSSGRVSPNTLAPRQITPKKIRIFSFSPPNPQKTR